MRQRARRRPGLYALAMIVQSVCASLVLAAGARAANVEPGPEPAPPVAAEGRVYEQVSPVAKNGNQAGPGIHGGNAYGVATPEGNRVLYSSTGPMGEASSGVDNFSVSQRSASGWETKAALPAPPPAPRDPVSPFDPVWLMPSADLRSVAFIAHNPFAPAPINFSSPGFSFASTYLSEDGGPALWLGEPTAENAFPSLEQVAEPAALALAGSASDMSTVYYEYYGTLVPEDAPRREIVAGGNRRAWGLYEWRAGQLKATSILPSGAGSPYPGKENPYGAVAAAIGEQPLVATPSDFDNEVSRSGNTALFVSPAPEAGSPEPPQLYARLNGSSTVLISRSELTGMPSSSGPDPIVGLDSSHVASYAYGSPDGSKVFFASEEQLTSDAPVEGMKEYEFSLAANTLSYLPGVTAPILTSSDDGSTLVFEHHTPASEEHLLDIYAGGHVTTVAELPEPSEGQLTVLPVRLSADASSLVFQTDAPIPGFTNGEGYGEIYRYGVATEGLSCVSCPPKGQLPTGTANLSNDTAHHTTHLTLDSRGISEDGSEIFFDTPDRLVKEDTNESRDVYEWRNGRISLVSSGTGTSDSLFLDNSASGGDVFFATRENLSGSDVDGSYDVYDARLGGGFPVPAAAAECTAACRPSAGSPPITPSLASSALAGAAEQVASAPPTPAGGTVLSRAQKLARGLKACKKKRGRQRHRCEAQTRRRYGKRPAKRHA